jgi:hypothetical protein
VNQIEKPGDRVIACLFDKDKALEHVCLRYIIREYLIEVYVLKIF